MKKTLIALAAVAVSSAAFAQSSVEIYGVADVGYSSTSSKFKQGTGVVATATGSVTADDNTKTRGSTTGAANQQAGSRIGFRGTEDLGGGLTAGFVYELGLTPTKHNGFANMSNRQAFVSLGSDTLGTVRIGRQYTGIFNVNSKYDVNGTFSGQGYIISSSDDWADIIRSNNVISYASPSFNGFGVGLATRQDSSTTTEDTTKTKTKLNATTLNLSYDQGPLSAMLSTSRTSFDIPEVTASFLGTKPYRVGAAAEKTSGNMYNLGASYDLGMAKVSLVINNISTKDKLDDTKTKYRDQTIGVSVPLGAFTVAASMSTGSVKEAGEKALSLSAQRVGVYYSLSPRTNLYFLNGTTNMKRKSDAPSEKQNGGSKTKLSGTYVGVRHTF